MIYSPADPRRCPVCSEIQPQAATHPSKQRRIRRCESCAVWFVAPERKTVLVPPEGWSREKAEVVRFEPAGQPSLRAICHRLGKPLPPGLGGLPVPLPAPTLGSAGPNNTHDD